MKFIAVTQRVEVIDARQERRDALDQRWIDLLHQAGFTPVVLPNNLQVVKSTILSLSVSGVIFTGGNDLVEYGGNAPERDEMESWLLLYCLEQLIPVLGVCRGMQLLQQRFDTTLQKVSGHISPQQTVCIKGSEQQVNSFHNWGSFEGTEGFDVIAKSADKLIKGIEHNVLPVTGIMWHPERIIPFRKEDTDLLERIF